MPKRVTIKDVAARAGVSTALVSMVLHSTLDTDGKPDCNISKEAASRILEAVKELGYIPNSAAASMRTGRTMTIAVITSDISSHFFSEICRLIENYFYEHGYNVIFASSDENPKKFLHIIQSAMSRNVDGMIILPPPNAGSVFRNLSKFDVPVVLLERDVPNFEGAGRVLLDNRLSVQLQIDELYHSGHRNIHLVTGDMDISTITEKIDAYKAIMKQKGLETNISVDYICGNPSDDEVERIIGEARSNGADSFCLNSYDITKKFIVAVKKMGLRIPEDIAFVGFNKSIIYDLINTSVSYILEPQVELAEKSASMLLDMMKNTAEPSTFILESTLVRGDSSR